MYFDGHADLLWDVTQRRASGETQVLARRHLERLKRGQVEGLVLSVWAHPAQGETYRQATDAILAAAKDELAECPEIVVVRTAAEAEAARKSGRRYAFLGVEGMAAVENDLDYVNRYAALGARMAMLTWNEENTLATGAHGDPHNGLTELGKQAIRRMESLSVLPDVSHLNDGGFADVVRLARGPILASHSNCRALCDVPRNLTDDQLRAIRDCGGVVGLNVHPAFLHADAERQTVEMLARHAAHMAEIMGAEHICCGFDFCEYMDDPGPAGLEDCTRIGSLFAELGRIGFSEKERQAIARENLLRLLA